jgi:hypothetical protein
MNGNYFKNFGVMEVVENYAYDRSTANAKRGIIILQGQ